MGSASVACQPECGITHRAVWAELLVLSQCHLLQDLFLFNSCQERLCTQTYLWLPCRLEMLSRRYFEHLLYVCNSELQARTSSLKAGRPQY